MAVEIGRLQEQAKEALRAVLERYTTGEGAVVRKFFSTPRTNEEYLEVVLRQIGREVQIAHWLPKVAQMGADLERGVGRWELYHTLDQCADEIKHHALLADIAEWLAGRELTAEELRKYEVNAYWDPAVDDYYLHNPHLPEAARMVDVTREQMEGTPQPIWKGVVKVSEGGGGQAFVEASRLSGDEFQRRFAKAMGEIADDEMGHGPEQLQRFVQEHVKSDHDLDIAARALTAIMAQHLRVRNEIYGKPLTEDELRSYDCP